MEYPNFDTVYDGNDTEMLKDAYQAITACGLWDWLRSYTPEENKGFMFSTHPNLDRINQEMKYGGHSGASYALTMRVMEDIAKRGWAEHARGLRKQPPACPCRAAKGYTTGWCGVAGGGVPGCDH